MEITTNGGAQRFGRHACAALASIASTTGEACRLAALYDPPGVHHLRIGNIDFAVRGFGGNRIAFACNAIRFGRGSTFAYLSHPNLAALGLLLRAARPGIPYIVATYGTDAWEYLPTCRRLGLRWATRVTALTRFTAQHLVDLNGVAADKVELHPPALEPGLVTLKGQSIREQFPPKARILLTVSRLVSAERKGVDNVIQALPCLVREYPALHYVVIGDGDDLDRLKSLAQTNWVMERVHFVGNRRDTELSGYYDACELYVMPSKLEGFGIVFIEAMAFGKPVVGGKHGGTIDIIDDGRTGFLVEHGDIGGLTGALKVLLSDDEQRQRMGEEGRRSVCQRYSFGRFAQRLTELRLSAIAPINRRRSPAEPVAKIE
jgi:glycosyltransferase involved in cell wall biosynthesis